MINEKSKEQKALEQIMTHGTKAQVCCRGEWCDIPLAQFPHTHKIGERKDADYDIEFYAVPEGTYVSAYDIETGSIKKAAVQSWSVHRGKEVEIVTLDNGKQIITDNDPRAVYGIAKNATSLQPQRFTPSEALKNNVYVPVVHGSGAPRFEEDSSLGELCDWDAWLDESTAEATIYKQHTYCDCYYDFNTGEIIDIKACDPDVIADHIVVKLDFEFGQFLGCMVGDGWWDKSDYTSFYTLNNSKRAIHLSDLKGDNAKFVYEWVTKNIGPVEYRTKKQYAAFDASRYGDTVTHTWFSPDMHIVTEALSHLLDGHKDAYTAGSRNKVLPAWAAYAPEDFRYGLICGLISTDGSINVHEHETGRKQLQVSFTSTSITLAKSMSSVLNSLKIPSRISVSKETLAGNISWILTISTPEFKRAEKEMLGMAHKDKLATLMQSTVAVDSKYNKPTVRIVFPECVSSVVLKHMYIPKITKKMRERLNEDDKIKIEQNSFAVLIYESAKNGHMTLKTAVRLYKYAWMQFIGRGASCRGLKTTLIASGMLDIHPEEETKSRSNISVPYSAELNEELKEWLDAAMPVHCRTDYEKDTINKLKMTMNRYARKGKAKLDIFDALLHMSFYAKQEIEKGRPMSLYQEPIYQEWMTLVNGGFNWAAVESVEKTGKVETGYDLTVPGYETFMNSEGVILSNTINVHVPSSDAAVKETYEKLMPSKTPHSDRIPGKIVPLPKQEQILGLYTAATAPSTGKPVVFDTEEEAIAAIRKGQVPLSADVEVRNPRTKIAAAVKEEKEKEVAKNKEQLLAEVGPIRNPKSGQFMPTSRDTAVSVEKAAASGHLIFTMEGIRQAGAVRIKTRRLSATLPITKATAALLTEASNEAAKGNFRPAMKLMRKYGKIPPGAFITGCDKIRVEKRSAGA